MKGELEIDWVAYFHKFVEAHEEPITIYAITPTEDRIPVRLLFRDGWQYSATDYQGPEIPPPESPIELEQLVKQYWTERKALLQEERRATQAKVDTLLNWQETRSLPLQQRLTYQDRSDNGLPVLRTSLSSLDVSGLQSDIDDLDYLIVECNEHLAD